MARRSVRPLTMSIPRHVSQVGFADLTFGSVPQVPRCLSPAHIPPMTHLQLDGLGSALADRYTIVRELGRGGMATVYLAGDAKHTARSP